MNNRLSRLLEKLSPEEQAEVETFAMFIMARRNKKKLQALARDIPAYYEYLLAGVYELDQVEQRHFLTELQALVRQHQASSPQHSILELKGLGKEIWQDIDAQEYVDQERDSWHG
jgi:hypothetical protein